MRREIILCIIVCSVLLVSCAPTEYPKQDYWQPEDPLELSHSDRVYLMKLAKQVIDDNFADRVTVISDDEIPDNLKDKDNRIYVTLRNHGAERACYSAKEEDMASTTMKAVLNAVGDERYGGVIEEDEISELTIELTILYDEQEVESIDEIDPGVHAIRLYVPGSYATFVASVPIVHNYGLEYTMERLCIKAGLKKGCHDDEGVSIARFEVYHFINKGGFEDVQDLYRSNIYFDVYDVDREAVRKSIDSAGGWMLNQLQDDGKLRYKYRPSSDSYPDQNNMIRQMMGTWSFARLYTFTGDKKYFNAWKKNMEYDLAHYYVKEDDFGYMLMNEKAKLGAAAFMLSSILEIDDPDYEDEKEELINFIYSMQEADGAFRTFFIPADRNDNQYYYPGEAMLALMILYEKTGDEEILAKVDKAFRFYRDYYRNKRNPAFIPWHTQALYKAYLETGKKEYSDFVFEMNDWLVEEMTWDSLEPYPDYLGRYYSEDNPYGPPHAASSSVYIEGLSDAFKLAKKLGEDEKAEVYRNAIILGMRSIINLQFREDTLFYVRNKELAIGGIRTRVYDNSIRIDNTQHTIMAFINVYDAFGEGDYLFDPNMELS